MIRSSVELKTALNPPSSAAQPAMWRITRCALSSPESRASIYVVQQHVEACPTTLHRVAWLGTRPHRWWMFDFRSYPKTGVNRYAGFAQPTVLQYGLRVLRRLSGCIQSYWPDRMPLSRCHASTSNATCSPKWSILVCEGRLSGV